MMKDEIYKRISDNKILFLGGSLIFFIISLPFLRQILTSELSCELKDAVCAISAVIPVIKTLFISIIIFLVWYFIAAYLIIPFLEVFNITNRDYKTEIDGTTVILLYSLSFLIPFAGFVVGAMYVCKKEEHFKHVGKKCLILTVLNIILSYIIMFILIDDLNN